MSVLETSSVPAARLSGPYIGLSFYTETDAPLFFGRDTERQVIMGNLRASRLTLLYAESGVGKSSLLRAGVSARLRELARNTFREGGSSFYLPIVFSDWRDDPVEGLILEIEGSANAFLAADEQLHLPRTSLHAAIEQTVLALDDAAARDRPDRPTCTQLIILDQFEECFLYGAREARTEQLAAQLADCINDPDLRANFLISIREDAYAALGDLLKARIRDVYGNYLHLDYLDPDAAREAIEKPLESYNASVASDEQVTIEPGLVESVLTQVRRQHDDGTSTTQILTPYMQLVMSTLWEREVSHGSRTLRLSTLEELHGAEQIVARHLETALAGFDSHGRELAIDVLHHLVTPSGTKIALEVGDLAAYVHRPVDSVMAVLNTLGGPLRILREVRPAPGKSAEVDVNRRFEIYHDVLARPINDAVSAAATRRLEREKRLAEEGERRERRRARRFRALAAVSFVLLLVGVAAAVLATVQTSRARHAQRTALSRQLAGDAVADLASGATARGVLLSIEAYRTADTADARNSLIRALQVARGMTAYLPGHTGAIAGIAFSPDGRTIASASEDGTVIVSDTSSSRTLAVLRDHQSDLSSVAYSPRGTMLASAAADGLVILFDAHNYRRVRTLNIGSTAVEGIAFNPDGTRLAAASDDGMVTVWDTATGKRLDVLHGHRGNVYTVAFSPDGRMLASAGDDRMIIVWSAKTGRRLLTLSGHAGPVYSVAFSPRGDTIASAGVDRTVFLWSAQSGRKLFVLRGHTQPVESVAFSPDGQRLATGGDDRLAIVWDLRTRRELSIYRGHTRGVMSVAFSPDGRTLATGSEDNTVIVWDARSTPGARTLVGSGGILGVTFSPDGRLVASAGTDRSVTVWDVSTGRRVQTLHGHAGEVEAVAFSPDGRTLASAGVDRTIRLWNVVTGSPLAVLRGHTDLVYTVAFSPDGRLLASGSADHTIRLWRVASGARLRTLTRHTNQVNAVAFSPDGKTLASAGGDALVILWNVSTGRVMHVLTGHTGSVGSIAFSPDGTTLASVGSDNNVILWNVRTGRRIGDPLTGYEGTTLSVAFGPGGRTIIAGSADGSVIVWNLSSRLGLPIGGHTAPVQTVAVSPVAPLLASGGLDRTVLLSTIPPNAGDPALIFRRLCGVIRRDITRAEWHQFLPDEPYRRVCLR